MQRCELFLAECLLVDPQLQLLLVTVLESTKSNTQTVGAAAGIMNFDAASLDL